MLKRCLKCIGVPKSTNLSIYHIYDKICKDNLENDDFQELNKLGIKIYESKKKEWDENLNGDPIFFFLPMLDILNFSNSFRLSGNEDLKLIIFNGKDFLEFSYKSLHDIKYVINDIFYFHSIGYEVNLTFESHIIINGKDIQLVAFSLSKNKSVDQICRLIYQLIGFKIQSLIDAKEQMSERSFIFPKIKLTKSDFTLRDILLINKKGYSSKRSIKGLLLEGANLLRPISFSTTKDVVKKIQRRRRGSLHLWYLVFRDKMFYIRYLKNWFNIIQSNILDIHSRVILNEFFKSSSYPLEDIDLSKSIQIIGDQNEKSCI